MLSINTNISSLIAQPFSLLSKGEDAVVLVQTSYKFFTQLSSWAKQSELVSVVEKEGVHPVREDKEVLCYQ